MHLLKKTATKKTHKLAEQPNRTPESIFQACSLKLILSVRASWSSRTSVITLRAGQENYVNHFIYSRTRTKCLTINGISATLRTADPQRSCLHEPCPLTVDYIINRL